MGRIFVSCSDNNVSMGRVLDVVWKGRGWGREARGEREREGESEWEGESEGEGEGKQNHLGHIPTYCHWITRFGAFHGRRRLFGKVVILFFFFRMIFYNLQLIYV